MLLSIITANVLLAEAMVAVALAANWHLTWWLWHVLMVLAFGFVAYSAYVQLPARGLQRPGCSTAVAHDGDRPADPRRVRGRAGDAGRRAAPAGGGRRSPADEMSLITAGMATGSG